MHNLTWPSSFQLTFVTVSVFAQACVFRKTKFNIICKITHATKKNMQVLLGQYSKKEDLN